ncbi:MAG: hypothetical protein DSY46_03105 [Hydrogenimonas sp.]|nr:MAG: hypothetical protein DSY46_03105 [Hydrogenimonas sp.]
MKKRLKSFLLSLILGSTIGAYADGHSLIGFEAKYHKANEVVSLYNSSSAASGLRLGAINDEYRILFMYDFIQDSEEQGSTLTLSQYLLTANFDVFIPLPNDYIKPFIGAVMGQGSYTLKRVGQTISEETGWVYGGEVGVLYTKNRIFNIDLFARYITGLNRVKDYIQAGIGVDYKF